MRARALGRASARYGRSAAPPASGGWSSADRASCRGPGGHTAGAGATARRSRADRPLISSPSKHDRAAARRMDAGQRLAERGLAAARFADDAERLARLAPRTTRRRAPCTVPVCMPNALRTGKWRDSPSTCRIGACALTRAACCRNDADDSSARSCAAPDAVAAGRSVRQIVASRACSADGTGSRRAGDQARESRRRSPAVSRPGIGQAFEQPRGVGMARSGEELVDRRRLDLLARHTSP